MLLFVLAGLWKLCEARVSGSPGEAHLRHLTLEFHTFVFCSEGLDLLMVVLVALSSVALVGVPPFPS